MSELFEKIEVECRIAEHLRARALPEENLSNVLCRLLGLPTAEGELERERRLLQFIDDDRFLGVSDRTQRYLSMLSFLAFEPSFSATALELRGKKRIYFARSRQEIERSGVHTHPQPIPNTDLWAMTNGRSAQKKDILERLLTRLGHGARTRRIALKAYEGAIR